MGFSKIPRLVVKSVDGGGQSHLGRCNREENYEA